MRMGEGWAVTVDLPATRKATDVIKNREALASALAVDEVQLIVERVRASGGHAGRVSMWVADQDPLRVAAAADAIAGRVAVGCVAAGAVRAGCAGPAGGPAAGVDVVAGGGDP
jgi:hypothetical protein